MTTASGSGPVRRSMPPTLRRPKADCASTSPLPTCRTFCRRPHGLCVLLILGAVRAPLRCAWRDLVFTSRCWIRLMPMLDFAKRAAREAGVTERIALKHGDATQLASLFHAESFDVILCHNILEYVEDPLAVLRSAARTLRDPSSIISILVRNQAGEVLKAAIQARRFGRGRTQSHR